MFILVPHVNIFEARKVDVGYYVELPGQFKDGEAIEEEISTGTEGHVSDQSNS